MKKFASIDVGSNSIRLLICEKNGNELTNKIKKKKTTRLGAGVSASGLLNSKAIEDSAAAVLDFYKECQEQGAVLCSCFGTSALRDAKNSDILIEKVKASCGANLQIIDGEKEAKIGFFGAGSVAKDERILLIDIGGGSTEMVFGNCGSIEFAKTYQAGVVRYLSDFFENTDELSAMKMLRSDLEDKIGDDFDYFLDKLPFTPVLIGGTATTIAMHSLGIDDYDSTAIHGHKMGIEELKDMLDLVYISELDKRKDIVGIEEQRASVILQGLLIAEFILHSVGAKRFVVSDSDSLEGAILQAYESSVL